MDKKQIANILVKHLTRPQKERHLVCQDDGCCIVCGHPFGNKEVRKRIKEIVNEINNSLTK